jgi:hypothetical protein
MPHTPPVKDEDFKDQSSLCIQKGTKLCLPYNLSKWKRPNSTVGMHSANGPK